MKYFDPHRWHPELYKTPKEADGLYELFRLKEKTIADVHIIGIASVESGRHPTDSTLIPQRVIACEPVVIVFTDGTTFELMPEQEGNGLLMAVNQISPAILDGTNYHNLDASAFFNCLCGRKIKRMDMIRQKTACMDWTVWCSERVKTIFHFWSDGDYDSENCDFFLSHTGAREGLYTFGVASHSLGRDGKQETAFLPFSAIKSMFRTISQVAMVEGPDCGGYFGINPVKVTKGDRLSLEDCLKEEISIDEEDVFAFLYFFLDKYFDPSFPYCEISSHHNGKCFEWYLEPNLYSYETMKRMLQDMEKCADLLEREYENPYLDGVKERYKWTAFNRNTDCWSKSPTDEEAKRIVRDNVHVAVDFYRRFVRRLKAMMEHAPECQFISFSGP
ncbi:MAG: hypothetical protein IKI50_03825 [Clostridia bacterium]|nr:hypothetical protein [Clostridia bacterium]